MFVIRGKDPYHSPLITNIGELAGLRLGRKPAAANRSSAPASGRAIVHDPIPQPDRSAGLRHGDRSRTHSTSWTWSLECDAPVPLGDVLDLSIVARQRALLLLLLAERTPADATALRDLARRLNVVREFPWHLVNQMTEAGPAASTNPSI